LSSRLDVGLKAPRDCLHAVLVMVLVSVLVLDGCFTGLDLGVEGCDLGLGFSIEGCGLGLEAVVLVCGLGLGLVLGFGIEGCGLGLGGCCLGLWSWSCSCSWFWYRGLWSSSWGLLSWSVVLVLFLVLVSRAVVLVLRLLS